jgi:EmrB/QacA subfamily drug resistance transporter
VLGVVCAAFLMGVLDSTSVYAALPSIADDLGLEPARLQWVATGYTVAIGGLLLLGGRAADLFGRRRMFLAGVGAFGAASMLCGLAWSGDVLIAARAVQGASAAVMTPAGMSILVTTFAEGPERNRAIGIWGGLGGIGATAGLLIGGPITDVLGWRWVFFTNVPICLVVLVLGSVLLREGQARLGRTELDVAGALAVTTALVALLAAVVSVPTAGWAAPRTIGLVVTAVALAGVFVVVEARSRAPLVPLRIFRSRSVVGGNLVVLSAGMAVDGLLLVVTLYVQQVLGYSATQFGLTMAVMTASSVVGVLAGQRLVTSYGARVVAAGGLSAIAVSCLVLTRISVDGGVVGVLGLGLVIFGPGMGAAFVAAQIAALTGVAANDSGLASGIEETSFAIGTALGVAIAAATLAARYQALVADGMDVALAQTEAVRVALGVAAAIAVTGAAAALLVLVGGRRAEAPAPAPPLPGDLATSADPPDH